MNNERGGIISKMIIIPVVFALMAGFFFLGYYVGKYQSKTNSNEIVVPLPEVVSQNLPKKEEFTFFKTLSDRENKTVSIDLKPKQKGEAAVQKKDDAQAQKKTAVAAAGAEGSREQRSDKTPAIVKPTEQKLQTAKKEPVITRSENGKARYTLQVASYPDRALADADVRKLKKGGFAAFVVSSEIQGKGTWYRVRVGSFASRASAEKLQKDIRSKEGITPFIMLE